MIEPSPNLPRERVEPNAVHRRHHIAPHRDYDARRGALARDDVESRVLRLEAMRAVGHGGQVIPVNRVLDLRRLAIDFRTDCCRLGTTRGSRSVN